MLLCIELGAYLGKVISTRRSTNWWYYCYIFLFVLLPIVKKPHIQNVFENQSFRFHHQDFSSGVDVDQLLTNKIHGLSQRKLCEKGFHILQNHFLSDKQ